MAAREGHSEILRKRVQRRFIGHCATSALKPDDSVPHVRNGLILAGVLHGVKTRPLAHMHVAQNLAGLAVQLDYPAGRSEWLVQRLHSGPQRPIRTQLERIRSSQVWNLAQELSIEVEFLNPPILALSNIEDVVLVDHDAVRQVELARIRACTAPLTNFPATSGVLKDARIGVSIADENPSFGRECNVGRSAESAERRCRLPAHVDLEQLFAPRTKLDDRRGSRVDGPDISLWVEPDRMRDCVQSFTKRAQDAAFLVNRYDRIRFVAPV
jgi:hypothetical protein